MGLFKARHAAAADGPPWHGHGPSRGRLAGRSLETFALVLAGWLIGSAASSPAQAQVRTGRVVRSQDGSAQTGNNPFSAIIQPSEEASTLLRRAGEAIERADWKLAVDSLQRLVELPGEHVLTSDGRTYESARRQAHRFIASLPKPGLEAYRLIYDGEAAALFNKGVEQHDPSLLHTVVERYLCTHVGDDAAVTLADWLVDEGRYSEAAGLLHQVQSLHPVSDLPGWVVPSRLAICAAGTGQKQRAKTLLKAAATQTGEDGTGAPAMPLTATTRPGSERSASTMPSTAMPASARIKQIETYLSRAAVRAAGEGGGGWPLPMGNTCRNGKLPAVEATFVDYPPWTKKLASDPKAGVVAVNEYARRNHLLPVRQMVTDGNILLVKAETELLALDVDSFREVWRSNERHDDAQLSPADEMNQGQIFIGVNEQDARAADAKLASDPLVLRLLHDSVGAGVTIAFNMALTVEWPADPPPLLSENMARRFPGGMPGRDSFSITHPNRVAAYSLTDGSFLWRTDSSVNPPAERPRERRQIVFPPVPGAVPQADNEIEFLSAPIPVGDYLLAPCRINSDLHAAVLDPKDGKLIRQVYLCGTGGGPFNSLDTLEPCVADRAVFIPTGRGLLVAVETSDWSVRWASRYDNLEEYGTDRGWLPTPAIAVADVVLLAPTDADYLFCFDRSSGELRWKLERENSSYLLGADDEHVWMGGHDLQMVKVETGERKWRATAPDPTGRGTIAGDRIYLPTVEGARVFNALTGEEIKMPAVIKPAILGNLLAWEGSLYNVATFEVSRYPDLAKGYEQAVARHAASPGDASRSIRLASLELLKDQPDKALAALSGVADDSKAGDKGQHADVIHLRVRAMLRMVSLNVNGVTADAALKLLRDARKIAELPEDAIESSLALGDYLSGKQQRREACLQYLSMILSDEGEQMMPADDVGTSRRARNIAAARLTEASKGLTANDARTVEERIRQFLRQAVSRREADSLLWLVENPSLGEQSHEAALVLGKWATDELRFEQAEGHFLRVLRRARSPELLAEATARLAALYLGPDEMHQPVSAVKLLDRLQHDFGTVKLPKEVTVSDATTTRPVDNKNQPLLTGIEVSRILRGRINAQTLAQHRAAMSPIPLGRPGNPTQRPCPSARPLSARGERVEPLADKTMLLIESNKLEAHRLADGMILWPAELRLLGDGAVDKPPPGWAQNPPNNRSDSLGRGRCITYGQTLVVNSEYGLHAIGLLTGGRRLWSRRFDPPDVGAQDPSASDAWIWAHDGYIVSVDANRHLDVADINQGDRRLWRCTKPDRKWAAVRARGTYVVAVDAALEQVDIFDLANGQHKGECRFQQDPSPLRQVNITLYDDVICGPASPREVVALELATPGVERWRVSMPEPISQIFKPRADVLAVADRGGRVQVIDPATGKKLMEAHATQCAHGVIDGALSGGVLYVCGFQTRVIETSEFEKQRWALAAIRMDNGSVLWQRGDMEPRTFLSDEILRCSSNAIPVAVFLPAGSRPARDSGGSQNAEIELTVLDKSNGKPIGDPVKVSLNADSGASRILDVQVWPAQGPSTAQVMVTSGAVQYAFPVSAVGGGGTRKDDDRTGIEEARASQNPDRSRLAGNNPGHHPSKKVRLWKLLDHQGSSTTQGPVDVGTLLNCGCQIDWEEEEEPTPTEEVAGVR